MLLRVDSGVEGLLSVGFPRGRNEYDLIGRCLMGRLQSRQMMSHNRRQSTMTPRSVDSATTVCASQANASGNATTTAIAWAISFARWRKFCEQQEPQRALEEVSRRLNGEGQDKRARHAPEDNE